VKRRKNICGKVASCRGTNFKKTDVPFLNEPKKRIIEDYLKLGREALDRKDSSFLPRIYLEKKAGDYIKISVTKLYFLI